VLRLVAEGLSNKGLAEQLNISEGTLKLHLHHIFRKTNLNNRSALMSLARHLSDELGKRLTKRRA
jgi:two-component system nitrate/nitrite response regulator NarL